MKNRTRWWTAAALAVIAAGAWKWHDDRATRFLPADTASFVAGFPAPHPRESAETRAELDQLLSIQASRTKSDVASARADRKTEISRFYVALGLDPEDPPHLPKLERLAQRVEDDVRVYVRAVKDHYRRLRPYEIEPRLAPCIADVKGDLSYPSGHAAFAWAMAGLLSDLVPERRLALEARADQFARQRMVCGVHFATDLAAGRQAAQHILQLIRSEREYSIEAAEAEQELRELLKLPRQQPATR